MVTNNSYQTLIKLGIAISTLVLASCSDSSSGPSINGADPGVLEAPIAFVKRPVPVDEDDNEQQSDLREPLFFAEGGDVYVRSNSTVTATEINITQDVTQGQGDVKDLKPSFDGNKLLFTLRLFDPDQNDDVIPSWNIFEYDLQTKTLRCILDDDPSTAECDGINAEGGDDISPAYLANGRIIFSSNRQRQSAEMLTNESKPRFKALDEDEDTTAMLLHVMNDDGGELHQISFNQSHDLDPTLLTHNHSGKVMFTRWDNAGGNNAMNLYMMTPDGTDLQVLYGVHSHDSGATNNGDNDATIQFSQPQEMEDGRILFIARPYTNTFGGGDLVIIDSERFINNDQAIFTFNGLTGPAQSPATINNISADNEISLSGRYSAAWPLWDGTNRVLVSKSSCELTIIDVRRPCVEPYLSDVDAVEASPAYSIWLYDMSNDTEKVIIPAEQGIVFTDIVALQSRSIKPDIISDKTVGALDGTWRDEGIGAIHIESVYDFGDGGFNGCFLSDCQAVGIANTVNELGDPATANATQRPARFVRFVKAVSLPDEDDPDLGDDAPDLARAAFGPQRNQAMREIIGYAPVEPDGSVKAKVPANIPLAISVLDEKGRRIGPRHQNWFTVRPGDTMECTGCHTTTTLNNATPIAHHRRDSEAPSINAGLQNTAFANTLIPGTADAYWGDIGETMAEVRFRLATASVPPSEEPHVSVDLVYEDYWTDPAVRTPDAAFSYQYANLLTPLPLPAIASCLPNTNWDFKCRILINYEQHIHPIWSLPRGAADADTCTNCHTNVDNMAADKVPDAQLDLSDGISDQNNQHFKSYEELFNADAGQVLDNNGQLVNDFILVPVDADGDGIQDVDQNGDLLFDTIDNPAAVVASSMSGIGARASYFIEKMTETELEAGRTLPTPTVNHAVFLSQDELRLISEWLDIGAQYFNDPFDPTAPMN